MGTKTDPLSGEEHFTPNMVNRELMKTLFTGTAESVKACGKELLSKGWRFYVVDQNRGRCYYRSKVITIPAWVLLKREVDYKDWYLSHEMAHAYRGEVKDYSANHGDRFMQELIRICPEVSLKYELTYKPRNAGRNGITENGLKKNDSLEDLFE